MATSTEWVGTPQQLDAGPRGGAEEVMSALSTGGKKKLCFFKGDAEGTAIGSHTVFDFAGEEQSVGMVQTWNQCNEMILTSMDKRDAMLIMDTERGATKAELNLRRQQKNWNMTVDSITPMQKFSQYQQSNEYQLFGLGDAGKTVFALTHDSRAGENVEEFVIRADSHRKYKSYTFTCHSQTKAGYLALGRTDGAIALYDFIMKDEKASCVIDGMPGPVTSLDVSADGSMIVWTTPGFVFFTCPSEGNWEKGGKAPKPLVLTLSIASADEADETLSKGMEKQGGGEGELCAWTPVKFDATTAKDADGLTEREIISYAGAVQLRWNVQAARAAWAALGDGVENTDASSFLDGVATLMGGTVLSHMTVGDDMDLVAIEGAVRGLHF